MFGYHFEVDCGTTVWKSPVAILKLTFLAFYQRGEGNMHLERKRDDLLTYQDLTVWVSHKLKFALYWNLQCFRFFHSELERKAVIWFCPNTQTYFSCHDMKWYNNWMRRVTVVTNPTIWLSKYLVSLYYFMSHLDAASLNSCWNLVYLLDFCMSSHFYSQITHMTCNPTNVEGWPSLWH